MSNVYDRQSEVSGWAHDNYGWPDGVKFILLDPMLGRVVLPADLAKEPPRITYHYGFSHDIGGGEYNRIASLAGLAADESTPVPSALQDIHLSGAGGSQVLPVLPTTRPGTGLIEITDSGRYRLQDGKSRILGVGEGNLEIRAVDGRRPLVVLAPGGSQGTIEITGGENSSLTLNGLLLAETQITVTGKLGHLYLRHCTLLPGLKTDHGGMATSRRLTRHHRR